MGPKAVSYLAIFACMAVVVTAAGILISNTLVTDNDVVGQPVMLTHVAVSTNGLGGETDHPDWTAGELVKSIAYSEGVRMQATASLSGVVTHVKIAKTGVNVTDVALKWWTGAAWQAVTLTDQGDYLDGVIGPAAGVAVTSSYDAITPIIAQFSVTGHFTTSIWAEAS